MTDNDFKKLIESAKKVNLSLKEKSDIRQSVLNFIENNPVRNQIDLRLMNQKDLSKSFWSTVFLTKLNFASIMAILLIISLMVGGGVAVGAEKSMPGDILYPVKVNFNEEVRGVLAVSNEAKANWEIERARRRLQEAEELAAGGSLDAEVREKIEANFQAHAERVSDRISKLENKENFNAAADVSSNFEVALRAHEKILARLSDDEFKVQKEINPIKARVSSEARKATKEREENETKVSSKVRVGVQVSAEAKFKAAESKIVEVENLIGRLETSLNAESKVQAEAKLDLARKLVVEGKAKLEVKAYGEAFVLFQKAIRIAEEAKLMLEAGQRLDIKIRINGDINDDNDRGEESGSDDQDDIKIETKTQIKGGLRLDL